jgi:hypothetical protein
MTRDQEPQRARALHEPELIAFANGLHESWPGSKRKRFCVGCGDREVEVKTYDKHFVRVAATARDKIRRELTVLPEEINMALTWARAWTTDPDSPFPAGTRGNAEYSWSTEAAERGGLSPRWLASFPV